MSMVNGLFQLGLANTGVGPGSALGNLLTAFGIQVPLAAAGHPAGTAGSSYAAGSQWTSAVADAGSHPGIAAMFADKSPPKTGGQAPSGGAGAAGGARGTGGSGRGGDGEGPKDARHAEGPTLLSGTAIASALLGPFMSIPNTAWAFLRYWEATSLVRARRWNEAAKSFRSSVEAFKRAGNDVYAAQTSAMMGYAVERGVFIIENLRKNTVRVHMETAWAFGEAYRTYMAVAGSYRARAKGRSGRYRAMLEKMVRYYQDLAYVCGEEYAKASKKLTTKDTLRRQFEDLPIYADGGITQLEVEGIIAKDGNWWVSKNSEGSVRDYGVPPEVGQMPPGLIAKALIEMDKEDIARRLELDEAAMAKAKRMAAGNITVDDYWIARWLVAHPQVFDGLEEGKKKTMVPTLADHILKKTKERPFRAEYVKELPDGRSYVTPTGIDFALCGYFNIEWHLKEILELPQVPTEGRVVDRAAVIRSIHRNTRGGEKVERYLDLVEALVLDAQQFPEKFFRDGRLTEAGIAEALRIVSDGKIVIEVERGSVDETEFEKGEGLYECPDDGWVGVKVMAPAKAITRLFETKGHLGVRFAEWAEMDEAERRFMLSRISRLISEAQSSQRRASIIRTVPGEGVELNRIELGIIVGEINKLLDLKKMLAELYPAFRQMKLDELYAVVDGVSSILRRKSFDDVVDDRGKYKSDAVAEAYKIFRGGGSRGTDYTPRMGGDADDEPDIGDEEPTSEIKLDTLPKAED